MIVKPAHQLVAQLVRELSSIETTRGRSFAVAWMMRDLVECVWDCGLGVRVLTFQKKKKLQPHKQYTSSTVICPNQRFCTCSFTKKYLISYKWVRAGQAHPKPELGQRFKTQNSTLTPNATHPLPNPLLIG